MQRNLTKGPITVNLLFFALPLMFGNLLQQLYNVADTWVVGRYLGADALAAVGSSYTLMTFLTSILLGLCMGSGAAISMLYGSGEKKKMRQSIFMAFCLIGAIALVINILVYLGMDGILWILRVPASIKGLMKDYLWVIFLGILATFLYNYFANLLRAIGNSMVPLLFLAVSSVLNIILDLLFVLKFHWGVGGAAGATVFSQYVSGIGICIYAYAKVKDIRIAKQDMKWRKENLSLILNLSVMTSLQQSIMNFGILMVQGLVNSFGTVIMAAFAAAVKIDSFAYMPVQDFGNAFSTYVAQNYGANEKKRIKDGIKSAVIMSMVFCVFVSLLVSIFAKPLMSVILTIASLGTRVLLAYVLSAIPVIGVTGIWMAVPIGWFLADAIGICYYFRKFKFIYSILYKPCIFKEYRLLNVQTLCIFPCFCPYEPKQGKFLFSADYLIQQSCGSTLRFPCSVSVNVHCGTDISVSEKFLHIFRCCTV